MAIQRTLAILVLVAAASPAHSKHVSSWSRGVFPDDISWLPRDGARKLGDTAGNEVDAGNYKVCETAECKKVADEFLSSMNKSVDPCDNFYEFTCGAWPSKDPIPPSTAGWSRFMIFQQTVQHRIKGVLETKPDTKDILPVRQAKKWYRSCMNIETLERRGLKPIESILMQAGGWPMTLDDAEWDSDVYTWQKVERHYARLTGAYTLYKLKADVDPTDPEDRTLRIEEPDLPLSGILPLSYRNYSGNDYDVYLNLVIRAANYFIQHNRADVSIERMRKDAEEMVEFEKKIYELSQQDDFGSMSIKDFFEWYDTNMTEVNSDPKAKIDWKSVIGGLFNMANAKLDTSIPMFSTKIPYIRGIGELLKNTPSRTIVNYIHWKFVATMLQYTTEAARIELSDLMQAEYGVKERAPRWAECVNDMKMTHAAAYVFVSKYFSEATEKSAQEMIKNIQIAMEDQIEKSNWLNEASKKWAEDKLKSMKMFIGFPDWYKNKTAVVNHYKGLSIGAEYFDNTLSYMRYENKKKIKDFADPNSRTFDVWAMMDPITVNAVYGPPFNMLNVPAADFQTPLFTPHFPDAVNYATTGVIAGHEMGHGFDDRGIQFGKSPGATRLPGDVLQNYYQGVECFSDQFAEYFRDFFGTPAPESGGTTAFSPGKHMGMQTRGENIADSTGLQSVFEAYKKASKNSPNGVTRLPGLEEFNEDQLFFISFGAMWCQVQRPELAKKKQEAKDVHSPPKFRVMGAVSNTKDFARAFNCPKGSPMNPTNKCNIWEKPGALIKPEHGGRRKERFHNRWEGQWKS